MKTATSVTDISEPYSQFSIEPVTLTEKSKALKLLQQIAIATNSADTIEEAMQFCLDEICKFCDWPIGHVFITNEKTGILESTDIWHLEDPEKLQSFREFTNTLTFPSMKGMPGKVLGTKQHYWVENLMDNFGCIRANISNQVGINSAFALPVMAGKKVAAVIEFFYPKPVQSREKLLAALTPAGTLLGRIIERRWAEKALKQSEELYRSLVNDVDAIVWEVKLPEVQFTFVSASAEKILGFPTESWYEKDFWYNQIHPDDADYAINYCKEKTKEGENHEFEYRMITADGSTVWLQDKVHVVADKFGNPSHLRGVMIDITEKRELSEQLKYQASHDLLTGLFNRHEFEHKLQKLIDRKNKKKEHALCYMDLDQFKVINDTCGHMAGDELLRQISEVLRTHLRKQDMLARLGGDEFGVLLNNCNLEQAQRIANTLKDNIHDFRFVWGGKPFNVGVSIGLVPITHQSGTLQELLSVADIACFAAKDAGRNRVHTHHPDDKELSDRRGDLAWVAEINSALEDDRFKLYMQPIKALKESQWANHYEILLRLEKEDGDLIPPGAFLPCAERYNLASKVDMWVVKATLKWLSDHPMTEDSATLCSINLSGQSLSSESFLGFLLEELENVNLHNYQICFEVTETAAISNLNHANHFLNVLQAKGCLFALDDFGSGLSSFNYLKHLPVDFVKIDGAFIRDIVDDPIDYEMVNCINNIGHVLGKKTIAEFVENDEILALLKTLGVDYVQGYGIGKPKPVDSIAK